MRIRLKGMQKTLDMVKTRQSELIKDIKKNRLLIYVKQLKDATPVDTGNARDGWRVEDNEIVNSVEYIEFLNDGHSDQAPARFIESTLLSNEEVKPNGIIVKGRSQI